MSDAIEFQFDRLPGGRVSVIAKNGTVAFADRCDPGSAKSRAALMKAVREALPGVDHAELERQILAMAAPQQAPSAGSGDPGAAGDAELAKMPEDVRADALEFLSGGDILARVLQDAAALGVTGERELVLGLYVLGTSRLLTNPLAAIVQGASSSGKSYVVERTSSMFPPESVLVANDLSPQALVYLEPGRLRHVWVVAGERSRIEEDDRAEATRMLREMLASGKLRKAVAGKDGDRIVTRVVESDGPIAYCESTTLGEIFDEDRNRCLLLATDDGADQTRAVLDGIGARHARPDAQRDVQRIRLVHHAAQRMLRRVVVAIPFAERITSAMPADKPEARRAATQCMAMVQAVCLLRQFERVSSPAHGECIEATTGDYAIARGLLAGPMSRSIGGAVPQHVETFASWLRTTMQAESWRCADLPPKAAGQWSLATVHRHVTVLRSAGRIAVVGQDGKANIYRYSHGDGGAASDWLPPVAEVAHA